MARNRIIDCIGASDEDLAHLRLLLRTAAAQLKDAWTWGTEDKADLVIVDTASLIGGGAHRRTLQRGLACAQLIEAGAAAPDGRFLRKPLRREDVVTLLNGIGTKDISPMAVLSHGDDFFLVDLGEFDDVPDDLPAVGDAAPAREMGVAELDAFEAMFKRDPAADTPKFLLPDSLDTEVSVEYTTGTDRSQSRADAYGNPFARDGVMAANIDPAYRRNDGIAQAQDDARYPLRDYLVGNLLGGSARITLPDAPALVLDPKDQVFHSEGRLAILAPYCLQTIRLGAWEVLTNSAMQEVRERVHAHPYLHLLWLDRYLKSGGRLAPHLDSGGRYRLTKRLMGLLPELQSASRIGSAMLTARRLDEIARESGADLNEVFDVVNAYESIGYVEWTHRERIPR